MKRWREMKYVGKNEEVERTIQMEKMKRWRERYRWREIKRADPMRLQLY